MQTALFVCARHVGKEPVHLGQTAVMTRVTHKVLGPYPRHGPPPVLVQVPGSLTLVQSASYLEPGTSGFVLVSGETPEFMRG